MVDIANIKISKTEDNILRQYASEIAYKLYEHKSISELLMLKNYVDGLYGELIKNEKENN